MDGVARGEDQTAAGSAVPDDLSVIGYDDIEVSQYLGLTTIRQPLYQSGIKGVSILMDLLSKSNAGLIQHELPIELVVRNSTATPGVRR